MLAPMLGGLVALSFAAARPAPAQSPGAADSGRALPCEEVSTVDDAMERGGAAFARRAEGARGTRAAAEPIGTAVACFERALSLDPDRDDVRAALLRALFYQGEYAAGSDDERRRIFLAATDLFEARVEELGSEYGFDFRRVDPQRAAARVGDRRADLGSTFFYGALHWGLWAQSYGRMAALREGVAKRIRDYGELSLAMAPEVSDAGPHRLVGQLHAEAPRVVFLTMWIDRDRALQELERAVELAPDDPLNLTYLAEALVEFRGDRRRGADLLERAVTTPPRPAHLVEDRNAIALAREARRALGLASESGGR